MILGPSARPYVQLGGEFARSLHKRGDLIMAHQYVNTEPAMVLWSDTRKAGAFAICLSVAHEYLDDHYLIFQSMAAAQQLGYSPKDKSTVKRIADFIMEGMDELVHMPPEPEAAVSRRSQKAEVLLRQGGPDGPIVSHQELAHDPFEQVH